MLFFALLLAALGADVHQNGPNPVSKVVQLLSGLQKQTEEEGAAEAKAYDEFACFCKEQADNKQYTIENFIDQEAELKAFIEDKEGKRTALDADVQEHSEDKSGLEDEQSAADGIRANENELYVKRNAQLESAISAMKRAIESLQASKKGMVDAKTDDSGSFISSVVKNSIALAEDLGIATDAETLKLLQQPDTAHAYEYHSNEIVATLNSLLKNFKERNNDADNGEHEAKADYEMTRGARRNQIKALNKAIDEKSLQSAQLTKEINAHDKDLTATEYAHDADATFLKDLTGKCEAKSKTFDQRSSTRTDELTAIAKAMEMLKGDVSKMYPSTGLSLVKRSAVVKRSTLPKEPVETVEKTGDDTDFEEEVSFLQVQTAPGLRKKLIGFLANKAADLKSNSLNLLLLKLREAPSPFAKVKQMINDLVERLEDEADSEASTKAFCDEEMASAQDDRNEAQRNIEAMNALITEKSALSEQLSVQIQELSQQIADLQKALYEEEQLRNKEKAANEKTIADAQDGFTAVDQAITFLSDFYTKAAFLQQQPSNTADGYERFVVEGAGSDGQTVDDMAPDAGGVTGDYKGNQDASKSILGLLEVIREDFSRSESSTDEAEREAASDYDTFVSETNADIDAKDTDKTTKEGERTDADLDRTAAEDDLKQHKKELQAALDQLEKLKPVCVDTGASAAERKKRREQEIESLKQALTILEETTFQ